MLAYVINRVPIPAQNRRKHNRMRRVPNEAARNPPRGITLRLHKTVPAVQHPLHKLPHPVLIIVRPINHRQSERRCVHRIAVHPLHNNLIVIVPPIACRKLFRIRIKLRSQRSIFVNRHRFQLSRFCSNQHAVCAVNVRAAHDHRPRADPFHRADRRSCRRLGHREHINHDFRLKPCKLRSKILDVHPVADDLLHALNIARRHSSVKHRSLMSALHQQPRAFASNKTRPAQNQNPHPNRQDIPDVESNESAMNRDLSRREFIHAGIAAAVASKCPLPSAQPALQAKPPMAVSSGNGLRAVEKAVALMREGKDVVEAAVEGVAIVELDPNDMSVGYGGLPNENGVVELDACVMHGPTMRAGAVGALQNIKTPGRVARAVMQHTDHVMLVGAGALAFAKAVGFEESNLLTEASRKAWMNWKSRLSKDDDWLDDDEIAKDFAAKGGDLPTTKRPTGTITCLCLNAKRELGGCTSTSGLAYKVPGRVGDSPIIGAGLYVDGDVGAAGST